MLKRVRASRSRTAAASRLLRDERFRVLALTPLEQPDLPLARALQRHGAAVALDLGRDAARWSGLLDAAATEPGLGLRLPAGVQPTGLALPDGIAFLVVAGDGQARPAGWRDRPWLAQVGSEDEARRALEAGAQGLIAQGQDGSREPRDESSFVLLQRVLALVAQAGARVPVWCQGGMGLFTAAGAVAGGAFGIVLDTLLAAYDECTLPAPLKSQVAAADGGPLRQGQPFGPDAAFGALLRAECSNLEALLHALRQRIAGQLHQARSLRVLDEGNAWARAHGVRYPVAQGPMTRVSDDPGFAADVAAAGAMPFLALALLPPAEARTLLQATRAAVEGRPWGVGLLAFAAPAVLEPQLQLVKEFRPSVLLLAGGRPAQARPFVELGIPTYLHVPSPALLEQFLADGATHFVFEGRECGGHVGPRYSFVLWEQVLARLARFEAPETLHLLFAGGIHDEVSAAMVAAIAAPLAARGAKVGVLMGTAYIATCEVVARGALREQFQRKALASRGTAIVETGPGHAIRCLPSDFVAHFEREKARLQAEGQDAHSASAALEALTVGRLRIASKGLAHGDAGPVPVDADRQEAEGLYMIGQAIALNRGQCTLQALHERVSRGATRRLAALQRPALPRAAAAEPVAIIGMAGVFPGAADLPAFWANIVEGRDAVGEVPPARWSTERYFSAQGGAGRTPSRWGGFLEPLPFDPLAYGIPPQSLAAIEPAQLLALEVAQRALHDAGLARRGFDRQRTAVIFGAESGMELANRYTFRNLYPQFCGELPPALAAALPPLTEDAFPGTLANVIAGRIANRLGLGGANYVVDAACASALAAVELGVKELRSGSSDLVLAGGADCHNGIHDYLMFAAVGALSPSGRCSSFDAAADGICLGEGVGVLVLKRLADAERDGDRIVAVIDAVAGASDGRALGLTAPNREGQKRALERSYGQAGVLPATVGLVEAHGTGTVVGDRIELGTLGDVFNAGGAVPGQTALGSVKSQIGHTKCAAGIAGMIKVALALHHRVLPPTLQISQPNAGYRAEVSPFVFHREAAPWLAGAQPRRAAVSAFGFGGTNFHALLSEHRGHGHGALDFPAELFVLRGESPAEARATLQALADVVAASDAPLKLRDLACSAWHHGRGPVQLAFVASDRGALLQRLHAALADGAAPGLHRRPPAGTSGRVAWLFPGQGSPYPGMLRALFVYFPALQARLARHPALAAAMLPPAAWNDADQRRQQQHLSDTRVAQPALGLAGLAACDWLRSMGLQPDMAGGQSYGELVALASAGALDAEALVELSRARAECLLASVGADRGAMAAVSLDAQALQPLLAPWHGVSAVNLNGPGQTVIAGGSAAIAAACEALAAQGIGVARLSTDCAFHSALVAGAAARFARVLAKQPIGAPRWPVYCNVTAAPHPADAEGLRRLLALHLEQPVRFAEQIQRMHDDGARLFVELGPRQALTRLTRRILQGREHHAVALDSGGGGLAGMLDALAVLAVHAPGFDAGALFDGRAEPLDLARPQRLPASTWLVDGGGCRPLAGPPPAAVPPPAHGGAPAGMLPAADQALLGYLDNLRQMVHAQRDVLLGYLGAARPTAPPGTPAPPAPSGPLASTPAPAEAPAPGDVGALLLDTVSRSTGYPVSHLDADLHLEADLSIDSIKRLEILGQLTARLGLAAGSAEKDRVIEGLSRLGTLRAMTAWLRQQQAPALQRHVLREQAAPAPLRPAGGLAGQTFAITDDGLGIAALLLPRLQAQGAQAERVARDALAACSADFWIDLWPLNPAAGAHDAKRLFAALHARPAERLAGLLVAGHGGLLRTLARERPALPVVGLDLDPRDAPDALAAVVEQALLAGPGLHELGWRNGRWQRWALQALPATAAGPLPLDSDSVLLLTGGARGITAQVALALAGHSRCRLHIVGRTPLPGPDESAATRDVTEAPALRLALLAEDASLTPAAVERRLRELFAQREGRATLARLQATGARVSYQALDVRDDAAFADCITALYRQHGRLDGVIHGAGVIDDKRIEDKPMPSFERVFDTKVRPALVLRRLLRDDLRFVVFFSSIASVFGNAGQADYAAANEQLDRLAAQWQPQIAGRVLSLNWGPWAGAGMVSPALARDFERRGIGLIAPEQGVQALLHELAAARGETQVLLTHGAPSAFGGG